MEVGVEVVVADRPGPPPGPGPTGARGARGAARAAAGPLQDPDPDPDPARKRRCASGATSQGSTRPTRRTRTRRRPASCAATRWPAAAGYACRASRRWRRGPWSGSPYPNGARARSTRRTRRRCARAAISGAHGSCRSSSSFSRDRHNRAVRHNGRRPGEGGGGPDARDQGSGWWPRLLDGGNSKEAQWQIARLFAPSQQDARLAQPPNPNPRKNPPHLCTALCLSIFRSSGIDNI